MRQNQQGIVEQEVNNAMRRSKLAAMMTALLLVSGCASDAGRPGLGQALGTILGTAAGAFVGSQIGGGSGRAVAVAVGGLVGGFIGRELGRRLDEEDRRRIAEAETEAYEAPVGDTVHWRNPDSGASGSVTPTAETVDPATQTLCRTFEHEIRAGVEAGSYTRQVCRQPDGSWKLI